MLPTTSLASKEVRTIKKNGEQPHRVGRRKCIGSDLPRNRYFSSPAPLFGMYDLYTRYILICLPYVDIFDTQWQHGRIDDGTDMNRVRSGRYRVRGHRRLHTACVTASWTHWLKNGSTERKSG